MSTRDGAWSPSDAIGGARDPDLIRPSQNAAAVPPTEEMLFEILPSPRISPTSGPPQVPLSSESENAARTAVERRLAHGNFDSASASGNRRSRPSSSGNMPASPASSLSGPDYVPGFRDHLSIMTNTQDQTRARPNSTSAAPVNMAIFHANSWADSGQVGVNSYDSSNSRVAPPASGSAASNINELSASRYPVEASHWDPPNSPTPAQYPRSPSVRPQLRSWNVGSTELHSSRSGSLFGIEEWNRQVAAENQALDSQGRFRLSQGSPTSPVATTTSNPPQRRQASSLVSFIGENVSPNDSRRSSRNGWEPAHNDGRESPRTRQVASLASVVSENAPPQESLRSSLRSHSSWEDGVRSWEGGDQHADSPHTHIAPYPSRTRQASSLASIVGENASARESRSVSIGSSESGVGYALPEALRNPFHVPDRLQLLINAGAWNNHQNVTSEERGIGPDRVLAADGSYIWFNSQKESISGIHLAPRISLGLGGVADGAVQLVRNSKPPIGPMFTGTAFQEPQPTALEKYTTYDRYVRDIGFGLWHFTPRSTLPAPPPVHLRMLAPAKISEALRACPDEYQLTLEHYFLVRVIDLSSLEYEGVWDLNLECGICLSPLVQPRTTECDHTYCKECLARALRLRAKCPKCRRPLAQETRLSPKMVTNILDDLKVHCPLRNRGCQEIVARSNVADHVRHHCGHLLVQCPRPYGSKSNLGLPRCTILLPRKELRGDVCRHTMVDCRHCPDFFCPEIDMAHHVEHDCPGYETECRDCSRAIARSAFEAHAKECAAAKMPCKAGAYGCDFVGSGDACKAHEAACALAKLVPWMAKHDEIAEKLLSLSEGLMAQPGGK